MHPLSQPTLFFVTANFRGTSILTCFEEMQRKLNETSESYALMSIVIVSGILKYVYQRSADMMLKKSSLANFDL